MSWLLIAALAIFVGAQWLPPEFSDLRGGIGWPGDASPTAERLSVKERQAIEATLQLIADDGPFPYERDGIEFRNREGRLPAKGPGYYREYTVETPGSHDRGARRIVTGGNGEIYYTNDHYETFIQLR